MTDQLKAAIDEIRSGNHATVNIRGKHYTTVPARVEILRKHFGTSVSIVTHVLEAVDPMVRVRAEIVDADGRILATGLAEEDRTKGNINSTSALENCETSAIGRALAALGIHGGEYATAGEVENSIAQQSGATPEPPKNSRDPNWQGPLTKGDLREKMKAYCEGLLRCESVKDLEQLDANFAADLTQCEHDMPGYLNGDGMPEEYHPINERWNARHEYLSNKEAEEAAA